ncbi:PHP domain-containing protein [Halobium salinum]|uniref:PHP domain-containing protein n=1 Tax=Halobium salinum TaxID=1364940 RepID=A0ABD5P9Q6_9EURY|nr:PHP-associated domain-containing protein [Halobium salinum]
MYSVDLHTHSRFFHGWAGRPTRFDPVGLRLLAAGARLRGLDGLAATNHDYAYSAEVGLPTIPGIEVSTTEGHVVVVGESPPRRTALQGYTPAEVVDYAHDNGCAAILAHPFRNSGARDADADFDAVEINGKNPEHIEATKKLARDLGLPLVGGSDAHYPVEVGRAYTRIDADSLEPRAVADAIRDGRVTAMTKFGPLDRLLNRAYTVSHSQKDWMDAEPVEN